MGGLSTADEQRQRRAAGLRGEDAVHAYRRPRRPGTGIAHRARPSTLAAVAAGGALGAAARYGVAQLVPTAGTLGFPWATFWTNVSGSLALGVILTLVLERFSPTRYLRPFLATGFLGTFTTYSTFAVETDLLAVHGAVVRALAYALESLVAGFFAVWGGMLLARAVPLGSLGRRSARRGRQGCRGRPCQGGGRQ